jgi:uncharacterized membrane protein YdjX (TVP38/TMEM64 family)
LTGLKSALKTRITSWNFEMRSSLSTLKALGRIVFVAVFIGIGAIWLARTNGDTHELRHLLEHHPAGPLLFLTIHVLASLLFMPRTAMAAIAGWAFGVWWGGALAIIGSLLGALAGFAVGKYLNPNVFSLSDSRIGPLARLLEQGGWRAVAVVRLVPFLPHSAINYAAGLTTLGWGPYAVGSLVGQLPLTVAFVQFGAAGHHLAGGEPDWMLPTLIGIAVLAFSALVTRLFPDQNKDAA